MDWPAGVGSEVAHRPQCGVQVLPTTVRFWRYHIIYHVISYVILYSSFLSVSLLFLLPGRYAACMYSSRSTDDPGKKYRTALHQMGVNVSWKFADCSAAMICFCVACHPTRPHPALFSVLRAPVLVASMLVCLTTHSPRPRSRPRRPARVQKQHPEKNTLRYY